MNKVFLNSYLFFIILEGKLISWDYKNHQQFELDEKHLNRLLEISKNSNVIDEIDIDLSDARLIFYDEQVDHWGWDCLSKIFHFGTKIKKEDLSEINIENAELFVADYIKYSESAVSTSPSILVEKVGKTVELPSPDLSKLSEINFLAALAKRKTCRLFVDEAISFDVLSTLLYVSFGDFHPIQDEYIQLSLEKIGLRKTSPSGGGLHSSEIYLLAQNIKGLEKGIYHYQAHKHILTLINSGDYSKNLTEIFCGQYYIENIAIGIFITSRLDKLWHKYPHSRAYRVALLDVGHVSQTFQLVATALNLNPWLSGAFVDDEVSKLLHLDELSEQPLFFVGAGIGSWSSFDLVTKKIALEHSL